MLTKLDIHKRIHAAREVLEDACSIVTFESDQRGELLRLLEEAEENIHVLCVQVRDFGIKR